MAASPVAVQVIFETTSVIWLPCTSIGVDSVRRSTTAVQPGTGIVDTEATGASSGRFDLELRRGRASLSLGTRKATRV